MNNLIWLAGNLVSVITLILLGFLICRKLRIPYAYGPVAAVTFCMVFLESAGACRLLYPCTVLVIAFSFLGILFWMIRTSKRRELWSYLRSPQVIGFFLACFFMLFQYIRNDIYFYCWDEFSHMGLYFKSVFYHHALDIWAGDGMRFTHPMYPQGCSAFFSLFSIFQTTYAERSVMFCINVIMFAAAAAVMHAFDRFLEEKTNRIARYIAMVFLCSAGILTFFVFAVCSDAAAYMTIYLDIPLGALFLAGILAANVLWYENGISRRSCALLLSLILAAEVTAKDIGLILVFFTLVSVLFHIWRMEYRRREKGSLFLFSCALPLLVTVIWKIALVAADTPKDQFSNMSLLYFWQKLRDAAVGTDSFFFDVIQSLWNGLVTEEISHGITSVQVIVFGILWTVFLLVGFWYRFGRKGEKMPESAKGAVGTLLLLILGTAAYIVALFGIYICGMSRGEALIVASLQRYMLTFFMGWFGALFAYTLLLIQSIRAGRIRMAAFLAAGMLVFLNGTLGIRCGVGAGVLVREVQDWQQDEIAQADRIKEMTAEQNVSNAKMLILSYDIEESVSQYRMLRYRYALYPQIQVDKELAYTQDMDAGSLLEIIEENDIDYVLVVGVSPDFAASCGSLFEDGLSSDTTNVEVDRQINDFLMLYRFERTNGKCLKM